MIQIELSPTQSIILAAACARQDRLVFPVAAKLKGGAVGNVCKSLLNKRLIEEVPATDDMTVWRTGDDGTPLTLRATLTAYEALGLVGDTGAHGSGQRPVRGQTPAPNCSMAAKPPGADTGPKEEPATVMAEQPETPPKSRKPRDGSKQEVVIAMLKRPEGASIAEIMAETEWLAHSVRGFIAGMVKKKLGLEVTSEKVEGRGRTYKIQD